MKLEHEDVKYGMRKKNVTIKDFKIRSTKVHKKTYAFQRIPTCFSSKINSIEVY